MTMKTIDLKIESGKALQIYKTASPEVKAILEGSAPAPPRGSRSAVRFAVSRLRMRAAPPAFVIERERLRNTQENNFLTFGTTSS